MEQEQHITEEQFEKAQRGGLDAAERARMHRHAWQCQDCRTRLYKSSTAGRTDEFYDPHLSLWDLDAYKEGRISDAEKRFIQGHLGACIRCRGAQQDLDMFIDEGRGSHRLSSPGWRLAAFAPLVAIAVAALSWQMVHKTSVDKAPVAEAARESRIRGFAELASASGTPVSVHLNRLLLGVTRVGDTYAASLDKEFTDSGVTFPPGSKAIVQVVKVGSVSNDAVPASLELLSLTTPEGKVYQVSSDTQTVQVQQHEDAPASRPEDSLFHLEFMVWTVK